MNNHRNRRVPKLVLAFAASLFALLGWHPAAAQAPGLDSHASTHRPAFRAVNYDVAVALLVERQALSARAKIEFDAREPSATLEVGITVEVELIGALIPATAIPGFRLGDEKAAVTREKTNAPTGNKAISAQTDAASSATAAKIQPGIQSGCFSLGMPTIRPSVAPNVSAKLASTTSSGITENNNPAESAATFPAWLR